jgi:Zn-dependent peptidase ImmA (M78 family)
MNQNLDDIADLAEDLGNRFLYRGKVNLEKIANAKRISFIKGNYGNHFLGQLVHYSRKFYIIINRDRHVKTETSRLRFTIAHELGHYFIDEHRNKLANGISLSFNGNLNDRELKQIEIAANHFAANLLMPKTHFRKKAQKLEIGLAGILKLKKQYDTSIESTTKHFVYLNMAPCVMIKWRPDYSFHYAWCSNSFSSVTGLAKFALPIRFDSNYIKKQIELLDSQGTDFIESATPLSRWISTLQPGSKKDLLGLEQSVKLGEFGGITLLIFK